ncbi:cyclic AMP-dependent transcription factor ATF-4 [Alosa sapidissima]|uniref:cyclic AMP-dependent transcription factor ATF-4 n=1 Tax=Alosa sapidissima TaxID=34773 RepID=UPI001C0A39B4|nr:cyclic AMP-dependent transcription factor ATF-4 [Alosa sapidissima]
MSSLSSQLAMEDVGSLFLGPSLLMDDPLGPLLDDEEEPLSEGCASPHSFSSYADSSSSSSPFPCLSPPPSPPTLLGSKADLLTSLPWLSADELLNAHIGAENSKEDAFSGMDWMSEKIDLSDLDLDTLIGSYESPSSPEELLASLESHMDLGLDPLPFPDTSASSDLALSLLPEDPASPVTSPLPEPEVVATVPEPAALEIEIKSEPSSPAPSPSPATYTLELGSEVDILELEKVVSPVVAAATAGPDALQASSIVLSLSPAHIVVVLASPKEELSSMLSSCEEQSDSDSGIGSVAGSPPRQSSPPPSPRPGGSSRTKPYSKPDPDVANSPVSGKVKTVSGAPKVVEKKLKKMEQNKTAATRYRQKKRVEQDLLNSECMDLEKRNRDLAEKADSISREIQYLKDLLEEVRSAKNRKPKGSTA